MKRKRGDQLVPGDLVKWPGDVDPWLVVGFSSRKRVRPNGYDGFLKVTVLGRRGLFVDHMIRIDMKLVVLVPAQ